MFKQTLDVRKLLLAPFQCQAADSRTIKAEAGTGGAAASQAKATNDPKRTETAPNATPSHGNAFERLCRLPSTLGVIAFDEVVDAHRYLKANTQVGKVVLTIDEH